MSKGCAHDYVTKWWCPIHGPFTYDEAMGHATHCDKQVTKETSCSNCGATP